MAKIFSISPVNPLRFIPNTTYNPSIYYTRHFDDAFSVDLIKDYQDTKVYFQKYTKQDRPMVQVWSDYEFTAAIYRCCDGSKLSDVVVNLIPTDIEDETWKVYEFTLDFPEEGRFQVVLTYEDDILGIQEIPSEPIEIRSVHPDTILFECTHDENDYDVIFETGFVSVIRVEAEIGEFKPISSDSIYIDQPRDTTLLNSVPGRQFTLTLGGFTQFIAVAGVPDWMADKVNRNLSLRESKLDGKYFTKSEGSSFDKESVPGNPFSAYKILISESENKFQASFDTSFLEEEMIAIQYRLRFKNNTSNVTINNTFKRFIFLEHLCVENVGSPFTIRIRTSTTGNDDDFDIIQDITNEVTAVAVNQMFARDKIILVEGINVPTDIDEPLNFFLLYKNMDATAVASSGGGSGSFGPGAVIIYEEVNPGDFAVHFDPLTGKGVIGQPWEGWVVCDGRNSTRNRAGRFPLGVSGFDPGEPDGAIGGSFLKKILKVDLPIFNLKMFAKRVTLESPYVAIANPDDVVVSQGGLIGYDQYRFAKANNSDLPTIGATSSIGGDNGDGTGGETAKFDITPPFINSIWIKKVA